jgi:hypothetical protein
MPALRIAVSSLSWAKRPKSITDAIRIPIGTQNESTNGKLETISSPTNNKLTPLRTKRSTKRKILSNSRIPAIIITAKKNGPIKSCKTKRYKIFTQTIYSYIYAMSSVLALLEIYFTISKF